jgi:hypothetical protein
VGAAAGQDAFKAAAGDAVVVLLVHILAQDVLLPNRAAHKSSSSTTHHSANEAWVSDAITLQLMYDPQQTPKEHFCFILILQASFYVSMCESFVSQPQEILQLSPPSIEIACGCLDSLAVLLGNDSSRQFALASRNPPLIATLVAGEDNCFSLPHL